MTKIYLTRSLAIRVISLFALSFGLLTINSAGIILFGDGVARVEAGNYVPFVLWFNFVAGFFYGAAGVGLWLQQRWAVWLAAVIVITTAITYAILGLHIYYGEAFEQRTLIAMSLHIVVWLAITLVAVKSLHYTGIRHD